jgi:uncharacterized membrane protein YcaP (DUF421 family)
MFDIGAMEALGIVGRVAVIYLACLVLLRIGKRGIAQLSQMDLLVMLLLSETVSPALTGNSPSVTAGLIAAVSLFGLYAATGWIAFKSRRAEALLQGTAAVLIEDGRVRTEVLRRFRITDDDLRATLHEHGILHVREVRRAFIEPDGEVTVIERKPPAPPPGPTPPS